MIKLVTSDLDETLLGSDGSISNENIEKINKLKDLGIKFVPNTGRGFTSLVPLLKKLNLYDESDEYVISYNGGAIVENKNFRVIETDELSWKQASDIFEVTKKENDFDTHIYTLKDVYIHNVKQDDLDYLTSRGVNPKFLDEDNLDKLKNEKIIKVITMTSDPDKLSYIKDKVMNEVGFDLQFSYSSNRYTEFNQIGVNKGEAIKKLSNQLGIKQDEIMAIGDNYNDLDMLKYAGLSVGVSNSVEPVKEVVQYVTKGNFVNGVSEAIDKFILK